MTVQKKGLGKGLNALMSTNDVDTASNRVHDVDINKITPNKNQPRNNFNDESLAELSESIKEVGIIQPIVVKKIDDYYEIIAGERRWRAARIAGLRKVPVIVRDLDELKSLEAALIENIQREDLNPIEEAMTYSRFSEEFNLTQDEIAKKVGKSRPAVANAMRLLNLDGRVQTFLKEGKISSGHARALLGIDNKNMQFEMADRIIDYGLSVRQTEELVRRASEEVYKYEVEKEPPKKASVENPEAARECLRLSNELKNIFGTKVNIKNNKGKGSGKIEIEYASADDLDRIIGLIKERMV